MVLTFTPVEEKATRALPQGCRHGLCPLRGEVGLEIRAGPDGPSAREEPEELERARGGTDARRTLFQTRSHFPALGPSLTWYLAFQRVPHLFKLHCLAVEWKVGLGCPQDLAALTFFRYNIHWCSLPRFYPLSAPPERECLARVGSHRAGHWKS